MISDTESNRQHQQIIEHSIAAGSISVPEPDDEHTRDPQTMRTKTERENVPLPCHSFDSAAVAAARALPKHTKQTQTELGSGLARACPLAGTT